MSKHSKENITSMETLQNPNPVLKHSFDIDDAALMAQILQRREERECGSPDMRAEGFDEEFCEEIDGLEVFDMVRHINDPEHPLTLEQLNVVQLKLIKVDPSLNSVFINFTPTIPHCSMATLIGLSLRVKLIRCLPSNFKVDIQITPGTHSSEVAVNKQLNDKERVAAAMENTYLIDVVEKCLEGSD